MSLPEVEAALRTLEEVAKKGHAPSHYVARHVLLTLGRVLAEPAMDAATWVERAQGLGLSVGASWGEAVQAELAFAIGEFTQCVDPRYLSLQNYDLEYTRTARARLEDRLRAAKVLGFELQPRDLDMLELADQVLATFMSARGP